jgi:predicted transcriptional regulator of viral defense system
MQSASKTLGRKTASLVTQLYEQGRTVFDLTEASRILGDDHRKTASLLRKAIRRGVFTSAGRGVFNLVPFELGDVSTHLADRYLLLQQAVGIKPYFLSHASALDLHRLQTQPNFNVYASTSHRLRDRMLGGNPVHFVTIKPDHFFGVIEHNLGDKQHVRISDLERTLIDAVRQPDYCGGFTEAAKAFFMAKGKANAPRIADYANRLGVAAAVRRAGFLMELFDMADAELLATMKQSLPQGVVKLDPSLDAAGPRRADWGLWLNQSPDALLAAAGT